jgi:hypothetical protein
VSRRFSWLWLAPVALWVDATAWSNHEAWRIAGELLVCGFVIGAAVLPRGQRASGAHALLTAPHGR